MAGAGLRTLTATVADADGGGAARELSVQLTRDGRVAAYAEALGGVFEAHPHALACAGEAEWRALAADCEAVFAADASFWLAHGAAPRCALEALARDIYAHHTRGLPPPREGEDCGAEWWTQVRRGAAQPTQLGPPPPPPHSRGALRAAARESVAWHWDKDEALVDEGGPTVHPAISTVTYIAGGAGGAPTVVVPLAPLQPQARSGARASANACYIVWPQRGKSIAFDGRWLHAAPRALSRAAPADGYLRVTLLVHVWRGWRPLGLEPLSAGAIAQLALMPAAGARSMSFLGRAGARVAVVRGGADEMDVEAEVEAEAEATYRFGATRRGELELSLPLPLAALDGVDDTVRVEFALQRGAVLREA
jgi:hypothetical protein